MSIVVALLVLAASLYLIGRPFLRPVALEEDFGPAADVEAEEAERERVFAALSDVEYDHAMNKLSEADYAELKAQLSRRAVRLLKEDEDAAFLSTLGDHVDVDKEIEAEIEAEIEREIGSTTGGAKAAEAHCPHCGARLLGPAQRYCQSCGGKLR